MSSIYDVQRQGDPLWAPHILGSQAGATIGQYGCFITSAAMVLTHYLGRRINPLDVDGLMDRLGLYVARDNWPASALPKLYASLGGVVPMIAVDHRYEGVPADLSQLHMADTDEAIVVVDFDHNPGDGLQTHAVRAFDWDGTTLTIDDPWYGTRGNFTNHYGTNLRQTILAIEKFTVPGFVPYWKRSFTPPKPPTPPVVLADPRDGQIADLTARLDAAHVAGVMQAGKILALNTVLDAIAADLAKRPT